MKLTERYCKIQIRAIIFFRRKKSSIMLNLNMYVRVPVFILPGKLHLVRKSCNLHFRAGFMSWAADRLQTESEYMIYFVKIPMWVYL